jgi:hypothetical protein
LSKIISDTRILWFPLILESSISFVEIQSKVEEGVYLVKQRHFKAGSIDCIQYDATVTKEDFEKTASTLGSLKKYALTRAELAEYFYKLNPQCLTSDPMLLDNFPHNEGDLKSTLVKLKKLNNILDKKFTTSSTED